MDTLHVRLGFIRGLTLLSRHHSPSLSIVDGFNFQLWIPNFSMLYYCTVSYNFSFGYINTFLSMSLNGIFLSGSSATGLFLLPCVLNKYVITPNATVTMTTPKPTNTGFWCQSHIIWINRLSEKARGIQKSSNINIFLSIWQHLQTEFTIAFLFHSIVKIPYSHMYLRMHGSFLIGDQ